MITVRKMHRHIICTQCVHCTHKHIYVHNFISVTFKLYSTSQQLQLSLLYIIIIITHDLYSSIPWPSIKKKWEKLYCGKEICIQQIVNLSFSNIAQSRRLTLEEELMCPGTFYLRLRPQFVCKQSAYICTVLYLYYNHFELKRNILLFLFINTAYDMVSIYLQYIRACILVQIL